MPCLAPADLAAESAVPGDQFGELLDSDMQSSVFDEFTLPLSSVDIRYRTQRKDVMVADGFVRSLAW